MEVDRDGVGVVALHRDAALLADQPEAAAEHRAHAGRVDRDVGALGRLGADHILQALGRAVERHVGGVLLGQRHALRDQIGGDHAGAGAPRCLPGHLSDHPEADQGNQIPLGDAGQPDPVPRDAGHVEQRCTGEVDLGCDPPHLRRSRDQVARMRGLARPRVLVGRDRRSACPS